MRVRVFVRTIAVAIAFAALSAPIVFQTASAQSNPCGGKVQPEQLKALQKALDEMSTTDPAVINRNLKQATENVQKAHDFAQGSGLVSSDLKKNKGMQLYEDRLEFWRQKKARLEMGEMVDIGAGKLWSSYLRNKIDSLQDQIAGTWNWWNGYTVTFSPGGGATYSGGSARGSGVWQKTGANTFHIHWSTANTNDNVTLSSDGKKLEGVYDGKPGTSTRRC